MKLYRNDEINLEDMRDIIQVLRDVVPTFSGPVVVMQLMKGGSAEVTSSEWHRLLDYAGAYLRSQIPYRTKP